MQITINYTDLYGVVERSLSIIGKRSADDQGNRLFTDITLGSSEKDIISDYIRQASIDLSTELSAHISASSDSSITITLPTNHASALEFFIQQSCNAYCVSYALHSWFTITAPRIAGKYLEDCKRQIVSVIRLVHDKRPPTSGSSSPLDISTNVTNQ